MEAKFLIILFVTIFYNGVTCSSNETVLAGNPTEVNAPPTTTVAIDPNNNQTTGKNIAPTPAPHLDTPVTTKPAEGVVVNNKTEIPLNPDNKNSTNSTQVVDDKTKPVVPVPAKKENATETPDIKPVIPSANTTSNSTKPSDVTNSNGTSANTTTTKPIPTTNLPLTTLAPTSTTTENSSIVEDHKAPGASAQRERQFDGASFIGGIVLTVGLTAIGFIAFKYYKAGKTNYTTF